MVMASITIWSRRAIRALHSSSSTILTEPVRNLFGLPDTVWLVPNTTVSSLTNGLSVPTPTKASTRSTLILGAATKSSYRRNSHRSCGTYRRSSSAPRQFSVQRPTLASRPRVAIVVVPPDMGRGLARRHE